MASATAETKTAAAPNYAGDALALLLADAPDVAVADVLKTDPKHAQALAVAWVRGDVEFGRGSHCVTGRPGVPTSNPTLIVESGTDWTGPKSPKHKRFAALAADAEKVPECNEYRKYIKEVMIGKDDMGVERWRVQEPLDGQDFRWTTVKILRPEAVALLALRVRLTDKGLAALQVA